MAGQIWPPDGIYAAIDGVQPASVDAVLNRLGAQAEVEELPSRNYAVLQLCQQPRIHRRLIV